jgi:hypothetical protein
MSWIWQALGGGNGGGGPLVESTLQPLNYAANIVAAYALNEPDAACNVDRSGNGKSFAGTFLASDMANAPDLIRQKSCIWTTGPYPTAPVQCRQTDNVWGITGPMTVAHRLFVSVPETGAPGLVEHCCGQLQGTPPAVASALFQWGLVGNGATPHCVYYFAETAAKAPIVFISTLSVMPNRWVFITVRRRADNTVRLGFGTGPKESDQMYQDSGALGVPGTAVANPRYMVIGAHQDSTLQVAGGMADLVVWNRFLTDAELVPQYRASMASIR